MTFYLKISENSTTRHLKFCKFCKFLVVDTAQKKFHIWSYSGSYFLAFGLNTDQNNSEYGLFLRSVFIYIHTHTHTHTHIYIYIKSKASTSPKPSKTQ